jgi:transposase
MLPYCLPNFHIDRVLEHREELEIHASSTSTKAACPDCQQASSSTHGWYSRSAQNLPSLACKIRLHLQVRRFLCRNALCARKTFVENLAHWLPRYARRTRRLSDLMQQVSLALGAEAGQGVLTYFGTTVSGDTLLRILRKIVPEKAAESLRVLGVDDWAFKKGKSYGSLLINLETHRVVDLLPDRTAQTLSAWLKTQTNIEIVTRDRSSDYAAGIREGAPQALQVADRWHLLLNLRQTLERYLTLIYANLQALPIGGAYQAVLQAKRRRFQRSKSESLAAETSLQQRLTLYELIQSRKREGWNIAQLAQDLRHHREIIRKYYYAEVFPQGKLRRAQFSMLDPYLNYLEQRLAEGCENAMQVWREIQELGYPGTARQVIQWIQSKRTKPSPLGKPSAVQLSRNKAPPNVLPSSKQLAWLLLREPNSWRSEDEALLNHLQQNTLLKELYQMVQRFCAMVKQRLLAELDPWLLDCGKLGIAQLQNFAFGLRQDYLAVHAALATAWSNGQTEGQVNRLKFIKRQMYGRAKFDLLRIRVLAAP